MLLNIFTVSGGSLLCPILEVWQALPSSFQAGPLWADGAGWLGDGRSPSFHTQACFSFALEWAECCFTARLPQLLLMLGSEGESGHRFRALQPCLELQSLLFRQGTEKQNPKINWFYPFIFFVLILFYSPPKQTCFLTCKHQYFLQWTSNWNNYVSPESHIIWIIPASDSHLGNRKLSE